MKKHLSHFTYALRQIVNCIRNEFIWTCPQYILWMEEKVPRAEITVRHFLFALFLFVYFHFIPLQFSVPLRQVNFISHQSQNNLLIWLQLCTLLYLFALFFLFKYKYMYKMLLIFKDQIFRFYQSILFTINVTY